MYYSAAILYILNIELLRESIGLGEINLCGSFGISGKLPKNTIYKLQIFDF